MGRERARREVQRDGPPLRLLGEADDVLSVDLAATGGSHEIGGVGGAEPQVVDPKLEELPRCSKTRQREGRLESGDEHDLGPGGDLLGEGAQQGEAASIREAMDFVDDEDERRVDRADRGGETGRHEAHPRMQAVELPREILADRRHRIEREGQVSRQSHGLVGILADAQPRGRSRVAFGELSQQGRLPVPTRGDHARDRDSRRDQDPHEVVPLDVRRPGDGREDPGREQAPPRRERRGHGGANDLRSHLPPQARPDRGVTKGEG